MTIGKKIFGGFGLVIAVLLMFAIFSITQLKNVTIDYEKMLDTQVARSQLAGDIQRDVALQGLYTRSYIDQRSTDALEMMRGHQAVLRNGIDSLSAAITAPELKEYIDIANEHLTEFEDSTQMIIAEVRANNIAAADDIMNTEGQHAFLEIQRSAQSIQAFLQEDLANQRKIAKEQAAKSNQSLITSILVDTALALLIASFIYRAISTPIRKLSQATAVLAGGDLTQDDIHVRAKDEIRELANSFNVMKHNLRNVILTINDNVRQVTASAERLEQSTENVTKASREVSGNMEFISNGARNSSAAAKESSFVMEETAAGVQRIAESAAELNRNAEETEKLAGDSEQSVQRAKDQMSIIYDSSHQTSELIERLSRQTAEIENITRVITDITDQTNLLALNAAIEAARAGEQGKGFAVVADEVRHLAEQSKNSASQIVHLTAEIQSDTKNVEFAVAESVKNAEQGVQVIEDAGNAFLSIVQAIQTMGGQIEEISSATEEISASAEEVSASVQDIAHASEEAYEQTANNTDSAEQQLATIEEINHIVYELSAQAVKLQDTVREFNV